MRYLSLFSGIGGFELGINASFSDAQCVGFSEIDPIASSIYRRHFPGHPPLGPIEGITSHPACDLLVGGFPCQDLSIGNTKNEGLEGKRSGLFYDAVKLLEQAAPRWFCIENVASMKEKNRDEITKILGVEPVLLDAADFSAQQRKRLFWANFPIRGAQVAFGSRLADVLETGWDRTLLLSPKERAYMDRAVVGGRTHWDFAHHHDTALDKARCLPANLHKGVPYNVVIDRREEPPALRKLSPVEAERLMGFPDKWTAYMYDGMPVAKTHRYRCVGNAVSIPVVKHIFSCLAIIA